MFHFFYIASGRVIELVFYDANENHIIEKFYFQTKINAQRGIY